MHVTAIVLAAGKGLRISRFNSIMVRGGIPNHISKMIGSGKSKIPKPLIKIDSKPLLFYCLDTFSRHPYIRDIIVVVNSKTKENIINKIRRYRIPRIRNIVLGGRARQDSVFNGLKAIDMKTDLVLIHDAVRPFIDRDTVSSIIEEAGRYGAAIVGVPVKATIKEVTKSPSHQVTSHKSSVIGRQIVKRTLSRDNLWEIQTPQVFKKDLILEAYKKYKDMPVTDDSALVERLKVKVRVVKGSYFNIKITTPEDLVVAEAILRSRKL